jgi:hypothetical protein
MQSHYNHETGLTETDSDGEVPFAHRSAQLADIAGLALLALPGSRGEGAPSLDESEASATPDREYSQGVPAAILRCSSRY